MASNPVSQGPLGFILAFHSQNVNGLGADFTSNDHVALDECLGFLRARSVPIVSLAEIVRRLRSGSYAALPPKYVAISFDDGSNFDWMKVTHPTAGPQEPMGSILKRHGHAWYGLVRRKIPSTSFVIASPSARREISAASLNDPELMSDDWWPAAHASGYMDIGSHGWDHVHPAVEEVRKRPGLAESFHNVTTADESVRQTRLELHSGSSRARGG